MSTRSATSGSSASAASSAPAASSSSTSTPAAEGARAGGSFPVRLASFRHGMEDWHERLWGTEGQGTEGQGTEGQGTEGQGPWTTPPLDRSETDTSPPPLARRCGDGEAEETVCSELSAAHRGQRERLAAIGEMVTTLAHESRNALQRIFSAVEMLQIDLDEASESMRDVGQIERAARDLQELLDEVRSYAAPLQLERNETDLGQLWQTAWQQVVTSRGVPQLQLEEERPSTPLLGCFDRFRLEQVFRNLFDNALAASPHQPRVRLRCDRWGCAERGYWRISLCDNGPGVPPLQRRRLFEPFYTTKRHGTGLGLVIVKRILEAHGGRVQFGPNQDPGAEVRIILPCLLPS